ncbi:MAG: carboxypeptidase-like regulatory domain-containing protein [Bacteroidetes bacterium]|nr:carboxypeptidase-like regulatory domain-containing protein [Bacteroidota bacterium]
MRKTFIFLFLLLFTFSVQLSYAQQKVKGTVTDSATEKQLQGVKVSIQGTEIEQLTGIYGEFVLNNVPVGAQVVQLSFEGFETLYFPIAIEKAKDLDMGILSMNTVFKTEFDASIISLSEDELSEDEKGGSENVSGLLQSSKDIFLRTAAFNFGQARFRVRGYDSSNGQVLMNGISMNKVSDGRPQWSNWGGLNDATRNQEFSNGLALSDLTFGGILGTTNINTRASNYRPGTSVSYATTNSNYTGRVMATHATGLSADGWAFTVSGSRRYATDGYFEGTTYNAWSGFLAAEKRFNDNHSLNLTAIYTPVRRAKSSANTQEVYDLAGLKYNSYWGYQNGEKRNSRIKEIEEPVVVLSHYWKLNDQTNLNTNVAYQFGHIGDSRLNYANASNPDPTYYRNLPSYFIRFADNLDYASAYLAGEAFKNDPNYKQINWENLYRTNIENGSTNYYLYEDRVDDKTLTANTILKSYLTDRITLNAGFNFKNLKSNNYAKMLDMLGGVGYMDLDYFATGDAQQNDLNNPNRIVKEGDKFLYHYDITSNEITSFLQFEFKLNKFDFYVASNFTSKDYQREGFYKNGTYAANSFGKSKKELFSDVSYKGGVTYKISGRHLIDVNAGYINQAPTIRNAFANSRVNNDFTPNLTSEKILTGDASYIFRAPGIQARLTGYYTKFEDVTETSFYFAEGLRGDEADFVAEILTGAEKLHFGGEFGIEVQVIPTLKLIGAAAVGQYTYNNNPNLYIQSDTFTDIRSDFGTAYIKDNKLSGTPQRAYSFGFEYRDPKYWWISANANLMSHNYLDISPLLRTDNFYLDKDGLPFAEATQQEIDALLKQERFDDAFLVNVVGGKSWRLKNNYYLGFFASINNVLGEVFKSGGYEQSRNANFRELKQDKELQYPTFGPKYYYGNDTSYYLNVYLRF